MQFFELNDILFLIRSLKFLSTFMITQPLTSLQLDQVLIISSYTTIPLHPFIATFILIELSDYGTHYHLLT